MRSAIRVVNGEGTVVTNSERPVHVSLETVFSNRRVDVEGGSSSGSDMKDRQEHRLNVVAGTIYQNIAFFQDYPTAMYIIPDPDSVAYRKRQCSKPEN